MPRGQTLWEPWIEHGAGWGHRPPLADSGVLSLAVASFWKVKQAPGLKEAGSSALSMMPANPRKLKPKVLQSTHFPTLRRVCESTFFFLGYFRPSRSSLKAVLVGWAGEQLPALTPRML